MNSNFRKQLLDLRIEMEDFVAKYGQKGGLELKTDVDVLGFVQKKKINSIRMWFVDALGSLKSFSLTPPELEGAFKEGMGFDGSSVHGYARINESDMVAFPIAETAQMIPFNFGGSGALRMFAQIRTPQGEPYSRDPRNVLKTNLEKLAEHDISHMNVGPEAEFFYFQNAENSNPLDQAGYFDMNPVDVGDGIREATVFALQSMGIPVEYHHHEVGPSQHEIDLKYKNALTMADNLMTYKWLVKEVGRRVGVHATFMPKPLAGENGSGMHIHISLFEDGKNLFFDKGNSHHLSSLAQKFMAGILRHAPELCLTTNQWTNSYKRLVPGFEAPVYIAWAERNRSALVRVPGKEEATRIELRFPDAACNPYFALSAILGAGLKGVGGDFELPNPIGEDLYTMDFLERKKLGVNKLPHDLYAAIKKAKDSELMKNVLGEETLDHLVKTKLEEYREHSLFITEKEREDYMKL